MGAIKSDNNQGETLSNEELLKRLDHLDEIAHRTEQAVGQVLEFIEEHRPALARGLSLMDPGARLRAAIGLGKRAGVPAQPVDQGE